LDAIATYGIFELQPGIVQIGNFTISWFGLNLTIGMISCWVWARYFAKNFPVYQHMLVYLGIASVFISKASLLFTQPEKFATVPVISLFEVQYEGFVLAGACLPLAALWIWTLKKGRKEWIPTLNLAGAFLCIMLLTIQLSETLRGSNDGKNTASSFGMLLTNDLHIVLQELDQVSNWQIAERKDVQVTDGKIPLVISGVFKHQVTDPEGMDRYMNKEVKNVFFKTPQVTSGLALNEQNSSFYKREGQQIFVEAMGLLKHPVRLYKVLALFIALLILGKTLKLHGVSIFLVPILLSLLLLTDACLDLFFSELSLKSTAIPLQILMAALLTGFAVWLRKNHSTFFEAEPTESYQNS
jgi:hypothetical protein